ncbi:uncharacterized protein YALI1_D33364g [Yarrowia lipolytica]|uniref:Secreted protein n=1 Tax=Yarrowia lipolytica TaxID=4952 RepID=A0A1D8NG65_YARLL|nr:hypothetical protein YALI1_D33364g [Yarrowia lipolytica]
MPKSGLLILLCFDISQCSSTSMYWYSAVPYICSFLAPNSLQSSFNHLYQASLIPVSKPKERLYRCDRWVPRPCQVLMQIRADTNIGINA